ncbi:MAG: transcriptional regulator [Thermoprotei archaeon]|nr:MAG: transcriptional regulator [Thermoprotei archaeon]HDD64041.1 ArsR family transcriptional regulator [Thermoprotei archaeon]
MRVIEILREINMPQDVIEYYRAEGRLNEVVKIPEDEEIREIVEAFKCLSNPIRLKLILLLSKPHCVCVLARLSGYDVTLISHHLAKLKKCNLVKAKPVARARIYVRNEEFLRELFTKLMVFFNVKISAT